MYTVYFYEGSYQFDVKTYEGTLDDAKKEARKVIEGHKGNPNLTWWATFYDSENQDDELFGDRIKFKNGKFV